MQLGNHTREIGKAFCLLLMNGNDYSFLRVAIEMESGLRRVAFQNRDPDEPI